MYIGLMGEGENTEPISQERNIRDEFVDVIKITKDRDIKRGIEQLQIIHELPEDIIEKTYAFLQAFQIESAKFSSGSPDYLVVEGYLNEILANIQIKQTRPELRGSTDPEIRKQLDVYEGKILEVASNPDRYRLGSYGGRNPDAAWLELDDQGKIIIKGVGEITASHQLNKRKYLQLSDTGFISNLRTVSQILNYLTDGESLGLGEFGVGKKQVEVANDIKRYLFVNNDFDASTLGVNKMIAKSISDEKYSQLDEWHKKRVLSNSEKLAFIDILNSPNTTIIKSAFSNEEIKSLTKLVMEKIIKRYPDYKQSK